MKNGKRARNRRQLVAHERLSDSNLRDASRHRETIATYSAFDVIPIETNGNLPCDTAIPLGFSEKRYQSEGGERFIEAPCAMDVPGVCMNTVLFLSPFRSPVALRNMHPNYVTPVRVHVCGGHVGGHFVLKISRFMYGRDETQTTEIN